MVRKKTKTFSASQAQTFFVNTFKHKRDHIFSNCGVTSENGVDQREKDHVQARSQLQMWSVQERWFSRRKQERGGGDALLDSAALGQRE